MDETRAQVGDAAETQELLRELAGALRELHGGLLNQQRIEYEHDHGPISGGAALLHLAAFDVAFAWLRALSLLMVDLDGLLGEALPASVDEARALRQELEELFSPAAPAPFWHRFLPQLQGAPVAMAYARVRTLLAKLPTPGDNGPAAELHAKHRWAAARRFRGES
jgi:hypothetical protein